MDSTLAVAAALSTLIGAVTGGVGHTTLTLTNARATHLAKAAGGDFGIVEQRVALRREKARDIIQGVSWAFVIVGAVIALTALLSDVRS